MTTSVKTLSLYCTVKREKRRDQFLFEGRVSSDYNNNATMETVVVKRNERCGRNERKNWQKNNQNKNWNRAKNEYQKRKKKNKTQGNVKSAEDVPCRLWIVEKLPSIFPLAFPSAPLSDFPEILPSFLSFLCVFFPFVAFPFFLDTPSHLYKRLCPSVRRSVGPSVRPCVRPSVCPVLFSKVKRTHTRRILCRVSGLVL